MPNTISQHEIESVMALPGAARHEHFLNRIVDWRAVYSLRNDDGFVMVSDDEGRARIPFWPHPDYARLHVSGDWSDCEPVEIELEEFVELMPPKMADGGVLAAVFPVPSGHGVALPALELQGHIADECAQYE